MTATATPHPPPPNHARPALALQVHILSGTALVPTMVPIADIVGAAADSGGMTLYLADDTRLWVAETVTQLQQGAEYLAGLAVIVELPAEPAP